MKVYRKRLFSALVLFCCLSGMSMAQTVRRVEVRDMDGLPFDRSDVLAFTGVRPGQEASQTDLSRDVRQLLDTGRFSYVGVEVLPAEDEVDVVFLVRRRERLVAPVEIEGNRRYRDARIREWLDLSPGDGVDDHVLAVRAARVRREYERAYYPDVRVEGTLVPVDPTNKLSRAIVRVVEGERARVVGVAFDGAGQVPVSELQRAVGQRGRWDPRRLFRKRRYDEHEMEAARIAVRDVYLNHGFLDVEVPPPEVATTRRGVKLAFAIEEGERYIIDAVGISGVARFPEAEMRSIMGLSVGDVASRATILAGVQAVRDAYGSRGYVDTQVRPVIEPSLDSGRVRIQFDVREGILSRVRNVVIRGNTRTRDKVIRREVLVDPGDVFDEVRIRRSERRLNNLGFFSNVRGYDLPTPLPDHRDLVFEVEEGRTGQFMIGAGFSSIDNLIGFMELSQGNFDIANWPYFSGGGQKLRMSVETGARRRSFEIGFIEPWFLDRQLALSTDLYRRQRRYREFDDTRIGGAVGLTRFVPGIGRVGLRYTLEQIRVEDAPDGLFELQDEADRTYRFTDEEDRYVIGRLRLTVSQDTRDRPFVPTRGRSTTLFAGLSGGSMGTDADAYELGVNARAFVPLWFGHVLSLRARAEVVDAIGSEDLNIAERLFVGGGRTLRGFGYRSVGPKALPVEGEAAASPRYRPVGGRTMLLGSAEYAFPVLPVLRLAAFSDAGNLWSEAFDADLSDLAVSGGFGLRVDIPGFPIRIDYAWALRSDDPLTETSRWVIWIGYD